VWSDQIDHGQACVRDFQAAPAKRTARYEEVIEDKGVDAVIIATPHHWHAPIALRAMAAGKDCYIEKPISHAFNEGPLIIAAAKKYGRVVQQGSQMRSSPVTEKAEKLLREGIIGEVKVARAWTAETRTTAKPLPDGTPPEGADYDRWLGPAPLHPFNPHRWHKTWRMFRDLQWRDRRRRHSDLDLAAWGLGSRRCRNNHRTRTDAARWPRQRIPGQHECYVRIS
jgi:hypothetical protein